MGPEGQKVNLEELRLAAFASMRSSSGAKQQLKVNVVRPEREEGEISDEDFRTPPSQTSSVDKQAGDLEEDSRDMKCDTSAQGVIVKGDENGTINSGISAGGVEEPTHQSDEGETGGSLSRVVPAAEPLANTARAADIRTISIAPSNGNASADISLMKQTAAVVTSARQPELEEPGQAGEEEKGSALGESFVRKKELLSAINAGAPILSRIQGSFQRELGGGSTAEKVLPRPGGGIMARTNSSGQPLSAKADPLLQRTEPAAQRSEEEPVNMKVDGQVVPVAESAISKGPAEAAGVTGSEKKGLVDAAPKGSTTPAESAPKSATPFAESAPKSSNPSAESAPKTSVVLAELAPVKFTLPPKLASRISRPAESAIKMFSLPADSAVKSSVPLAKSAAKISMPSAESAPKASAPNAESAPKSSVLPAESAVKSSMPSAESAPKSSDLPAESAAKSFALPAESAPKSSNLPAESAPKKAMLPAGSGQERPPAESAVERVLTRSAEAGQVWSPIRPLPPQQAVAGGVGALPENISIATGGKPAAPPGLPSKAPQAVLSEAEAKSSPSKKTPLAPRSNSRQTAPGKPTGPSTVQLPAPPSQTAAMPTAPPTAAPSTTTAALKRPTASPNKQRDSSGKVGLTVASTAAPSKPTSFPLAPSKPIAAPIGPAASVPPKTTLVVPPTAPPSAPPAVPLAKAPSRPSSSGPSKPAPLGPRKPSASGPEAKSSSEVEEFLNSMREQLLKPPRPPSGRIPPPPTEPDHFVVRLDGGESSDSEPESPKAGGGSGPKPGGVFKRLAKASSEGAGLPAMSAKETEIQRLRREIAEIEQRKKSKGSVNGPPKAVGGAAKEGTTDLRERLLAKRAQNGVPHKGTRTPPQKKQAVLKRASPLSQERNVVAEPGGAFSKNNLKGRLGVAPPGSSSPAKQAPSNDDVSDGSLKARPIHTVTGGAVKRKAESPLAEGRELKKPAERGRNLGALDLEGAGVNGLGAASAKQEAARQTQTVSEKPGGTRVKRLVLAREGLRNDNAMMLEFLKWAGQGTTGNSLAKEAPSVGVKELGNAEERPRSAETSAQVDVRPPQAVPQSLPPAVTPLPTSNSQPVQPPAVTSRPPPAITSQPPPVVTSHPPPAATSHPLPAGTTEPLPAVITQSLARPSGTTSQVSAVRHHLLAGTHQTSPLVPAVTPTAGLSLQAPVGVTAGHPLQPPAGGTAVILLQPHVASPRAPAVPAPLPAVPAALPALPAAVPAQLRVEVLERQVADEYEALERSQAKRRELEIRERMLKEQLRAVQAALREESLGQIRRNHRITTLEMQRQQADRDLERELQESLAAEVALLPFEDRHEEEQGQSSCRPQLQVLSLMPSQREGQVSSRRQPRDSDAKENSQTVLSPQRRSQTGHSHPGALQAHPHQSKSQDGVPPGEGVLELAEVSRRLGGAVEGEDAGADVSQRGKRARDSSADVSGQIKRVKSQSSLGAELAAHSHLSQSKEGTPPGDGDSKVADVSRRVEGGRSQRAEGVDRRAYANVDVIGKGSGSVDKHADVSRPIELAGSHSALAADVSTKPEDEDPRGLASDIDNLQQALKSDVSKEAGAGGRPSNDDKAPGVDDPADVSKEAEAIGGKEHGLAGLADVSRGEQRQEEETAQKQEEELSLLRSRVQQALAEKASSSQNEQTSPARLPSFRNWAPEEETAGLSADISQEKVSKEGQAECEEAVEMAKCEEALGECDVSGPGCADVSSLDEGSSLQGYVSSLGADDVSSPDADVSTSPLVFFSLLLDQSPEPSPEAASSSDKGPYYRPKGPHYRPFDEYSSPLKVFRSYRMCTQFQQQWGLKLSSPTWSHRIDPMWALCPYEVRGVCNNAECEWQHERDYALEPGDLTAELCQYANLAFSPELVQKGGEEESAKELVEAARRFGVNGLVLRPGAGRGVTERKDSVKAPLTNLFPPWKLQKLLLPHLVLRKVNFRNGLLAPAAERALPEGVLGFDDTWRAETYFTQRGGRNKGTPSPLASPTKEEAEEDWEAALEEALEAVQGDLITENVEDRDNALAVLSRALDKNPHKGALWQVYLQLFAGRAESAEELWNLFEHAVRLNPTSYELWLLYLQSQDDVSIQVSICERARAGVSAKAESLCQDDVSRKVLDLMLWKLSLLCEAGRCEEAVQWIEELADTGGSTLGLSKPHLALLVLTSAHVILHQTLPRQVSTHLGFQQDLPLLLDLPPDIPPAAPPLILSLFALATSSEVCLACVHFETAVSGCENAKERCRQVLLDHPYDVDLLLAYWNLGGRNEVEGALKIWKGQGRDRWRLVYHLAGEKLKGGDRGGAEALLRGGEAGGGTWGWLVCAAREGLQANHGPVLEHLRSALDAAQTPPEALQALLELATFQIRALKAPPLDPLSPLHTHPSLQPLLLTLTPIADITKDLTKQPLKDTLRACFHPAATDYSLLNTLLKQAALFPPSDSSGGLNLTALNGLMGAYPGNAELAVKAASASDSAGGLFWTVPLVLGTLLAGHPLAPPEAWGLVVDVCVTAGEREAALEVLQVAIHMHPGSATLWNLKLQMKPNEETRQEAQARHVQLADHDSDA